MQEMTGLHVVIVPAWWPSPEEPIGGVFFADYALAYAKAGAKVGVVVPDLVSVRHLGRGTSIPWLPRTIVEDVGGVPVVRIRGLHTAFGRPGLQMRRFRRWLRHGLAVYRDRHGEPDVLHAMCAIPAGWACTHLADRLSDTVVVTEHTGPFSLVLSPKAGESYVRSGLKHAARIVAVSDTLRSQMQAANINREIAVVGNPVAPVFQAVAPPSVEMDDRGRLRYRALFVGRFTALKGLHELVNAAVKLAKDERFAIEWHMIGYGELEAMIRERFKSAGLAHQLVMHGLRDKPAIAESLQKSHFLILPSHGENCPLAICEALTAGRPVVTTDVPGCQALVGENEGEIVQVGNAESLASGVARLLADDSRWNWQSISARARNRFSGESVASKYAAIFRAVIEGGG